MSAPFYDTPQFAEADVLFRWTPSEEWVAAEIARARPGTCRRMLSIAEEYVIERLDDAVGGLVVHARYSHGWFVNGQDRHLVRYLLMRGGYLPPVEPVS